MPLVAPALPVSLLADEELGVLGVVVVEDEEDEPPGTTTVSRSFVVVVDEEADPLGAAAPPPGITVVSLRSHAASAKAPTTNSK